MCATDSCKRFSSECDMTSVVKKLTPFHLFLLLPMPLLAASAHPVDESNVVWESPSTNAAGSMPIGNGDLGLNVWVEEDGDLRFYIAKTDAWDQNGALLKLGGIRVSLSPNPFAKGLPFRQELRLRDGEIRIQAGEVGRAATLRVWVDANQPVIRVEAETEQPSKLTVRLENWRTEKRLQAGEALWYYSWHVGGADGACLKKPTPVEVWLTADSVLDEGSQRVVWYHRNEESNWGYAFRQQGMADVMGRFKDPLLKRTFGAAIACKGLKRVDKLTLASAAPQKHHAVSLHPLTAQTESAREWLAQLDRQIARTERTDIGQARGKHQQWWREFWDRSFIRVTRAPLSGSLAEAEDGVQRARAITRAYALQRWVGACAGRGAFPIKFNGSLFTVDTKFVNGASYGPDGRLWGGDYWWQNTRLPYWPMLASGDFELMRPLFEMYFNRLPVERARTKAWFGCEGAFMAETASFWGMMSVGDYGYQRPASLAKGETENGVMRYYWQPGLELTHMMLDYYEYTGDRTFFRERLAPMAEQYLLFYQTRFGSDAGGKLRITPAQSLETWANVVNPAPDVVALRQNVSRLLALPEGLLPESLTKVCRDLRPALPEVALKQADGVTVIGFAGEIHCQRSNVENPELYPVYPYRNFGLGRPGLDIARATFERRMNKETWGWQQSGMQAACLGLADEAALILAANVKMGNPAFRFPVMWGPNYDWVPDQDHGGNMLNTLQQMLLQADGRKILVLPAWPKGWEAEFKLHAPYGTTVEGTVRDGKMLKLEILPKNRKSEVMTGTAAP